jgi:eukaryotic-like serine/threonine-protein kinase
MGHVYEAFDPELERKVALKVLRSRGTFGDDERSQKRLAREAKTMARLSNPHVVAVHDVGMFAGRVFLVMELVEGTTLADWLRAKKRPWRDVLAAFVAAGAEEPAPTLLSGSGGGKRDRLGGRCPSWC